MRKDYSLKSSRCMLTWIRISSVNIGNAAIFGLREDLELGGVEYNVALTIFFIPYILCEIPSNLILKKVRPRIWRTLPLSCLLSHVY